MPGKRISDDLIQLVYYNYCIGKSAKELAEMFSLKLGTVYNIIKRAEKEGRLYLKSAPGGKKKINLQDEGRIIKKFYENPSTTTRSLASEIQKECGFSISHETVRKVIKNKYLSADAQKKPFLSSANKRKRLYFAQEYILYSQSYWEDVIFCDETEIMVYNNQEPRHSLKLKSKKCSILVRGYISSKGVGELKFIEETINTAKCLDLSKSELRKSAEKFGFIDESNQNKFKFKLYQNNDPKHKSHLCSLWGLKNCSKVINTPPHSSDLNPIEDLWAFLKERVSLRAPKSRNSLIQFIQEEWTQIPNYYDIPELIFSIKRRLQAVINAHGGHTSF